MDVISEGDGVTSTRCATQLLRAMPRSLTLALIVVCVACSSSRTNQASPCVENQLAPSPSGGPDRFVKPSYVPAGFRVEVFEDRGPRRVLLTGKKVAGVSPVVDLQLFVPEPGAGTKATPEIQLDGSHKFSAKWDVGDRTVLATSVFVDRDEFDKIVRSIAVVDAAQFCGFVAEHDGRVFYAASSGSR